MVQDKNSNQNQAQDQLENIKIQRLAMLLSGVGPAYIRKQMNQIGFEEQLESSTDNKNIEQARQIKEKLDEAGVSIVIPEQHIYPSRIKTSMTNWPVMLFVKGAVDALNQKSAGVVGTRKSDAYGISITKDITENLIESGYTIVSGGALGVDTIAHKTALKLNARTVAVLGTGVFKPYPRQNLELFDNIVANNGAIVSFFMPETGPVKTNFPARNRLIAALSDMLVVTRAPEKSGAVITAQFMLGMKKPVLVAVGDIRNQFAKGIKKLVEMGAKPLLSLFIGKQEFIAKESQPKSRQIKAVAELDSNEKLIYEALQTGELTLNQLVERLNIASETVLSSLTLMEIKELVKRSASGTFFIP